MSVYVIGHKNPDTDAICSAIGYAWFLQNTSVPEAIAACCGEVNARTQFVLTASGMETPKLLMDVRPTLAQIMRRQVITARTDEALFEVYRRMQKHHVRAIPALDPQGGLAGLVTFSRLMELVLPDDDVDADSRLVETSLHRVAKVLEAELVHAVEPDIDEQLILMVAAMSSEGFTQRMKQFPAQQTVIVAGDRPTVQLPAIEYGARALIVTGGYKLSPGLLRMAREHKVSVLISPHDTATTLLLLRSAKIIAKAIAKDYLRFPPHAQVERIAKEIQPSNQELYPVVEEDGRLAGVFSKSDLVNPARTKLILVDHNELAQAVTGADQAEILEVIDHHRVGGGLVSREPIRFINEPLGSTCTIVTKFLHHRNWVPPKAIGQCLAAGMVADTLNLTSPTTTTTDRDMLAWLARSLDLDIPKFTEDFFAAGSVLEVYSPAEALRIDCKEYEERGRRFAVAQIEELGLDHFWEHQPALERAIDELVREKQLHFAALMITDITRHFSLLMVAGEEQVRDAIDYPRQEGGLYEMDGVVSRKKQLLPHLIRVLGRLEA